MGRARNPTFITHDTTGGVVGLAVDTNYVCWGNDGIPIGRAGLDGSSPDWRSINANVGYGLALGD